MKNLYKDAHRPFIRQQAGLPEKPIEPKDIEPLPHFGVKTASLVEQTANYYNCGYLKKRVYYEK